MLQASYIDNNDSAAGQFYHHKAKTLSVSKWKTTKSTEEGGRECKIVLSCHLNSPKLPERLRSLACSHICMKPWNSKGLKWRSSCDFKLQRWMGWRGFVGEKPLSGCKMLIKSSRHFFNGRGSSHRPICEDCNQGKKKRKSSTAHLKRARDGKWRIWLWIKGSDFERQQTPERKGWVSAHMK